jgi:hypothetical protein
MNDPPPADAVRTRVQQLRCQIDGDVEDMAARARTMVDWKHYVKTYPWACLGAAVALEFLIVPKRSRAVRPDSAALTELAKSGHPGDEPAPAATRGLVEALLVTIAGIAAQKAIGWLGQSAARWWTKRP